MPEIKLGSSTNAKNINLGSKEIEEVRLGRVLVWINNIAPQVKLTSPDVGEYGDLNFPIGVSIATTINVIFSARDLDILDEVVSYAVDGPPGFTPKPTTPITPGNPVSGLFFTIPNTLFVNPGEPTTNNVFTITVTDQRGKEGIYTVTVISVSIDPPTVSVSSAFGNGTALLPTSVTKSARFTINQSSAASAAGYTAQYKVDNGPWTNGTSVTVYRNTTCGNSASASVSGRSVKSGQTTAYGNTAYSSFSVDAPPVRFFPSGGGCVTHGGVKTFNSITSFFNGSQSCNGVISGAGTTRSGRITLTAASNYLFTGTSYQSLSVSGGSAGSAIPINDDTIRYDITYTVPSVAGATIPIVCSGGDIRISQNRYPYTSIVGGGRGDVGTSTTGYLLDRGPDWTYDYINSNTSIASISGYGGFGNTSSTITFNEVGLEKTKPAYSGYYRRPDGSRTSKSGNNPYTRTFEGKLP